MSGGGKAFELQLQMRQNTEDMLSFIKDLESWETDTKKKDEDLKTGGPRGPQEKLPAVRNKDYKAKMKGTRKKEPTGSGDEAQKHPRIKSYDYRTWDKFDVEKALSEVDKEESPPESNASDSEDAGVDRGKALAEKEMGNTFFKEGKYNDAVECYTRGMEADPYDPALPTNRAASFYRLKKFAVAESDCSLAIALDSSYHKAYARRGAARFALKNYQSALEDYETVLRLDPENTEALNEAQKIKEVSASLGKQEPGAPKESRQPKEAAAVEAQQRKQEAVTQKDRGNGYFKEGKYEAAVECYSRGIEADDMNVLLSANRAMAFLKLARYAEAEVDCTRAIYLDGTYSKAFARRATARAALGKPQEAKQDFQEVLRLEPGNKQALNELQKLQIALGSGSRLHTAAGTQRRTVQPVDKPAHLRSAKPLRRIDIEEVSGKVSEAEPDGSTAFIQEVGGDAEDKSSSPSAKMIKIEENAEVPSSTCSRGDTKPPPEEEEEEVAPPRSSGGTSSAVTAVPPPPTSGFQLEAGLRRIGNHPEGIYRYLRQIEPDSYIDIFHNSLEPDTFYQILRTLRGFYIQNEDAAVTLAVLRSLASVRRFDMAVMFMSSSEKKVLKEVFDFLHRSELEGSSVTAVQKKYGV
ncbi:RNA polymerase II-associated protein 3 [Brachionichthys hirsutus]|uniref:RNA polymerase II-associated protein 3 n=1 Tax=Brachionichthys hirsutus TaxID=412623 RepID=UPI00360431F5